MGVVNTFRPGEENMKPKDGIWIFLILAAVPFMASVFSLEGIVMGVSALGGLVLTMWPLIVIILLIMIWRKT